MKKSKRRAEELRVADAIERAEKMLGIIGKYELTIIFDWGYDGDSGVDEDGATNVNLTCASTNANWQYMRARIRFHMPIVATLSDERLYAVIVHEFCHILINPLDSFMIFAGDSPRANDASKANEYTTECVTRAIMAAAGLAYPSDHQWRDEI